MDPFRVAVVADGDLATGNVMPRSFPRLATPTPQVRVVRYPVHSFPISTHCPQYGRLRSHFTERFLHEKQSSVAPVAGALLLLFLGAAAALLLSSTFLTSMDWVVVGEATAILSSMRVLVVTSAKNVASVGEVSCEVYVRKMDKWTRGNSQWSIERRIKVGKYYLALDG